MVRNLARSLRFCRGDKRGLDCDRKEIMFRQTWVDGKNKERMLLDGEELRAATGMDHADAQLVKTAGVTTMTWVNQRRVLDELNALMAKEDKGEEDVSMVILYGHEGKRKQVRLNASGRGEQSRTWSGSASWRPSTSRATPS